MGNKIDKICFCINANNVNTSQDEQVIITFINRVIKKLINNSLYSKKINENIRYIKLYI